MPIKDNVIAMIRRNSLRAFKTLSRGKGVSPCTFYPAVSGTTQVVKRNLYHDVIEDTGPGKVIGIPTFIYVDMNPPATVVKKLGWWKEDFTLPTLGYMPYEDTWTPEQDAIVEIASIEGYISGTWKIEKVTMYGQGVSCLWVCNIVPKRF